MTQHSSSYTSNTPIAFTAGTAPPTLALPPLACDCHMHIYGDGTPATQDSPFTKADLPTYLRLRKRLGVERTVVVTPSAHGLDNSLTLNAIEAMGTRARGVAVINPDCSRAEMERLHRGGIRGIRMNLVQVGATNSDMLEALAGLIADFGWHIQFNLLPELLIELAPRMIALPVPVVLDHFSRIDSLEHPAYPALARLLDSGNGWVKLSSAYALDRSEAARVEPLRKLAHTIATAQPKRILWGTNWPHPTYEKHGVPLPDDAQRIDQVGTWIPDEHTRRLLFVDNPQTLYQFD